MSHYSTLVVLPREPTCREDLDALLEGLLAPFDENMRVERYKDHEKPLPADWRERVPRYVEASAKMSALREPTAPGVIGTGPVPEENKAEWERWREVYKANDIPWPYSPIVTGSELQPPMLDFDLSDPAAVCAELARRWDDSEPYEFDEQGIYQWSTYNPDSKWDYWRLGGRWGGYFQVAPDAPHFLGDRAWEHDFDGKGRPFPEGAADCCRKGDVIVGEMQLEAAAKRAYWFDDAMATKPDDERLRQFMISSLPGETRDEYIVRGCDMWELLRPWGVLAEGVWKEKEDYSDEATEKFLEWFKLFWEGMPDETWLAAIDIHI